MASLSPSRFSTARTIRPPRPRRGHRIGQAPTPRDRHIEEYLRERAELLVLQMRLVAARQKMQRLEAYNEHHVPSMDDVARLRLAKEAYSAAYEARRTQATWVDDLRDELIDQYGPRIYHYVYKTLGRLAVDTFLDQSYLADSMLGKLYWSDLYDFLLSELEDEEDRWEL